MKLLVCGGRDFNDWGAGFNVLRSFIAGKNVTHIIHGDYRGADQMADAFARENGIQPVACAANWDKFKGGAGPRRNGAMLELKPDYVIAFPGGTGTADMIAKAKAAGIPVKSL